MAINLDALSTEVSSRLQEIYRRKLSDLGKLKEALLQKAFSGELTSPPLQAIIKEAAE
jgi:type I restriction enzyme S subunit